MRLRPGIMGAHQTPPVLSPNVLATHKRKALTHQGDALAAHAALAQALEPAARMGYISIFLEEGAPMAALLEAHSAQRKARCSSPSSRSSWLPLGVQVGQSPTMSQLFCALRSNAQTLYKSR